MVKSVKRVLALGLLLVVCISTTGLNVFTHLCASSGDSEVSMRQLENCCGTAESGTQTSTVKDDCCSTNHLLFRLDLPIYQPESDTYSGQLAYVDLQELDSKLRMMENINTLLPVRPPPDLGTSGRKITIAVQSFLI